MLSLIDRVNQGRADARLAGSRCGVSDLRRNFFKYHGWFEGPWLR
jgi:hypothetical protein